MRPRPAKQSPNGWGFRGVLCRPASLPCGVITGMGPTHPDCAFADTLQSVPFVQDLTPIATLKADGFISPDAVIANGNSGDYISGGHVVPEMRAVATSLSEDERLKRITAALFKKHFALWAILQTPDNWARIERQLLASIMHAGASLGDPADDYGLYEYAEFQDRQCKFVITGQRIYEYLGHDWRLPLWDKAYLDFFEAMPLTGKANQRLYADMLEAEDWAGVWRNVPVNAKVVRPHWLRPLRFAAKLAHAPLGVTLGTASSGDIANIGWNREAKSQCADMELSLAIIGEPDMVSRG